MFRVSWNVNSGPPLVWIATNPFAPFIAFLTFSPVFRFVVNFEKRLKTTVWNGRNGGVEPVAQTPWGGDPPLDSTYWMDWFNYYLGLGYRWEDAAKLSWMEIEHRSDNEGRLAIGVGTLGEEQLTPGLESTTHFERRIARWVEPNGFRSRSQKVREVSWVSPWPGSRVGVGWEQSMQRRWVNLFLHIDIETPEKIEESIEATLRETRVLSAISALVSASLAEGYQRTADEREMLKSVIRTSLSRKISGRIFDLRLASVFEREPLSANDAAIPMTATEAG